jgi:hypothetical protein
MKNNRFIALTATLVLAFAISLPAEAQFGNLLKKAKQNVEKTVKKKVDDASKQAENKIENGVAKTASDVTGVDLTDNGIIDTDDSSDNSLELTKLYKSNFKPSAAAKAADPDASNTKVGEGHTRSYAQIRGAYEHLDPFYFPLQPYYKYPVMYGLGDKAKVGKDVLDKMILNVLAVGLKQVVNFQPFVYNDKDNAELVTPAGEKMGVFRDDVFRYAYAAQFFADPNSKAAVYSLAELLAYNSPIIQNGVRMKADDEQNGILDAKNEIVLPSPKYDNRRYEREGKMVYLASSIVDIDLVADCVIDCLNKVEANDAACQQDPSLRVKYCFMGNELYSEVLVQHDNWSEKKNSDPKMRKATMLYNRWSQSDAVAKLCEAVRVNYIGSVPMPKGVSVSADIKAKGDAAGRQLATDRGDEFVEVVYLKSEWEVLKEKVYPYRIIMYYMPADLITINNGKKVLTHCELHKSPDGQRYVMSVGYDTERHPIKQ